jgi:hypothetical protein
MTKVPNNRTLTLSEPERQHLRASLHNLSGQANSDEILDNIFLHYPFFLTLPAPEISLVTIFGSP